MVDSCPLNLLKCLNNGKCIANISANTTYCQCDPCYEGIFCENDVYKQTQFNTGYVHFIIFVIGLCFSVLNNSLVIELFIRCERIRRSNCGIYLIVYSILSLVGSILLVTDEALQYSPNRIVDENSQRVLFYCYFSKISFTTVFYLCIWFSSSIALQRGLIIRFGSKMDTNRWLSFITIIVIFTIAGGSATPMLVYKCDWDNVPLQTARAVFIWLYLVVGIAAYVLATLLVLISFVVRIHRYGTENGSHIKTFFKLLRTHLFIFVPPIAYIVSYAPYNIVINLRNPNHAYLQCGISTGEYIIKILLETLTGVPYVLTWLLFVYPSRVYMNEFYLNTWSGQRLANIIIFLKSYNGSKNNVHLSTMKLIDNDHDIRESSI